MANAKWLAHDYDKGVLVELKEKYGNISRIRCNVLYEKDNTFYLSDKDGLIGSFPKANYSAKIIKDV